MQQHASGLGREDLGDPDQAYRPRPGAAYGGTGGGIGVGIGTGDTAE